MTQLQSQNVAQAAEFSERRADHRNRVLKSGTLLFNQGYAAFACRVRNLTEHGAMLEMTETTGLPNEFEFRLGNETERKTARIIWRDRARLGIRFT